MLKKTKAVVLNTFRYQEKSLIVKCFTKDYGLKTYFVKNAFSKRNKSFNSAYFQPLNQLHIEAFHKDKGTMEHLREIKLSYAYRSIPFDYHKNSIGFFLAEILSNCIKAEQSDYTLYHFIETALVWLDEHDFNADFHLWFLLNLSKYLGFFPDISNETAVFFNPTEGCYTDINTSDCYTKYETQLFRKLCAVSIQNSEPKFTNEERRVVLKLLLTYYSFHSVGFKQVKSLKILPELFR